MSLSRFRRVSYLALIVAAACGDGDALQKVQAPADPEEHAIVEEEPEPEPVVPDEIGLPCEVKHFLVTNCQGCHSAEAKNGTPLLTRDNLLDNSKKDPERKVFERMMARMSDMQKPMPPMGKGQPVSNEDLEMFVGWIDEGMPAGRCDE